MLAFSIKTTGKAVLFVLFVVCFVHGLNQGSKDTEKQVTRSQCIDLCARMERDCYFDCGKNTNIKSIIMDLLWVRCTDECDAKLRACTNETMDSDAKRSSKMC